MLDLDFVRSQFPALDTPWILMDNAGGSAPCRAVIERVQRHMERLPFQLGAAYPLSVEAEAAVAAGRRAAATLVGAEPDEVVLGPSSTQLVQRLAAALRPGWSEGDEVVVTDLDHEANVGPWRRLEETGIVVRTWCCRRDTLDLDVRDLEALLGERTRLVAFTHASNVVGRAQDVAALAVRARAAGALTCVDGVAYAAHRRVDVRALGVDFYTVSLYKTYGPHQALLFGRREALRATRGQNHFFVPETSVPAKLEPGGVNYELVAALPGILAYLCALGGAPGGVDGGDAAPDLDAAFARIAAHETLLLEPLLGLLRAHPRVRVVGSTDAGDSARLPTVSFHVPGRPAAELTRALLEHSIAVRDGHFYAPRLIRALGLEPEDGVVRVSLAHYNTPDEVGCLVEALGGVL